MIFNDFINRFFEMHVLKPKGTLTFNIRFQIYHVIDRILVFLSSDYRTQRTLLSHRLMMIAEHKQEQAHAISTAAQGRLGMSNIQPSSSHPTEEDRDRTLDDKTLVIGCEIQEGKYDWTSTLQLSKFIKTRYRNTDLRLSLAFVKPNNQECALEVKKFLEEEKTKSVSKRLFSHIFIESSTPSLTMGCHSIPPLDETIKKLAEEYPEKIDPRADLLVEVSTNLLDSHEQTETNSLFWKLINQEVPIISIAEHGSRFRRTFGIVNLAEKNEEKAIIANMGLNRLNHDIGIRLYDRPNFFRAQFLSSLNHNKEIFPISPAIGKKGHQLSVAYLPTKAATAQFIYMAAKLTLNLANKEFYGLDIMTSGDSFDLGVLNNYLNEDKQIDSKRVDNQFNVVHITPANLREKVLIPSSENNILIRVFTGFPLDNQTQRLCYQFSDLLSGFSEDNGCCQAFSADAVPFHSYPVWKTKFHFDVIHLCLAKRLTTLAKYFLLLAAMNVEQANTYIEKYDLRDGLEDYFGTCHFATCDASHLKKDLVNFIVENYQKISQEYLQFKTLLSAKYNFWNNIPHSIKEIQFST